MPKLAFRTTLPRPDDPAILESISSDLAMGVPLSHAATLAGIAERTAHDWQHDGLIELDDAITNAVRDNSDTVELGSHAIFALCLKEARASFVREGVSRWRTDEKGWQKWATLLERRDNANFAQSQNLHVEQRSVTVNVLMAGDTTYKLDAARDALQLPAGSDSDTPT